jgi:hypothetical protein
MTDSGYDRVFEKLRTFIVSYTWLLVRGTPCGATGEGQRSCLKQGFPIHWSYKSNGDDGAITPEPREEPFVEAKEGIRLRQGFDATQ